MTNHLNDKTKLEQKLTTACGKPLAQCSCHEIYAGLLSLVQDLAGERQSPAGKKKLYYISAEFLIGKLLSNNLRPVPKSFRLRWQAAPMHPSS